MHKNNELRCGNCAACLSKAKKKGKCLNLQSLKDRLVYDVIEIPNTSYILKMEKSILKDCEHLQLNYRKIVQMRSAFHDRYNFFENDIQLAERYIDNYTTELEVVHEIILDLDQKKKDKKFKKNMQMFLTRGMVEGAETSVDIYVYLPVLEKNVASKKNKLDELKNLNKYLQEYCFDRAIRYVQYNVRGFLARQFVKRKRLQLIRKKQDGAVTRIQCLMRAKIAVQTVNALKREWMVNRTKKAALDITRVCRGRLDRKGANVKRIEKYERLKLKSTIQIQCCVRKYVAVRKVKAMKWEIQKAKRLQDVTIAARLVQRVLRGYFGRKRAKRFKIQDRLHGRLAHLLDRYLVNGQFWSFMDAINEDYLAFQNVLVDEEKNARIFMKTILDKREQVQEERLQNWYMQTNEADSKVANFNQTQTTYQNKPPQFEAHVYHPNKASAQGYATKFDANCIRRALAAGYSLNETIATLRGLQAQRKPTNNLKIMFSALRRRAPVMTNRHESERIVRERTQIPQNSKYVVFPSLAEGASQYFKYEKQSLFAYRDVTRYLVRGYEESTESLLKLVAVRCFVFDEPNSWFNADNHVFESYLKLSHLERVRHESRSWEAAVPYMQCFIDNHCYVIGDLTSRKIDSKQLQVWGLPIGIAKCTLRVLHEYQNAVHYTSTTPGIEASVPTTEILPLEPSNWNDTRPDTAATVAYVENSPRPMTSGSIAAQSPQIISFETIASSKCTQRMEINRPNTPPPKTTLPLTSMQSSAKSKRHNMLRDSLESDMLTPSSMEEDLGEFVFKAVFRVCPLSDPQLTDFECTPNNFDDFVQLLVEAKSAQMIRSYIKERSKHSKYLLQKYMHRFNKRNIHNTVQLINFNFAQIDIPQGLENQLRTMVAHVITCAGALDSRNKTTSDQVPRANLFDTRFQRSKVDPLGKPARIVTSSKHQLSPLRKQH